MTAHETATHPLDGCAYHGTERGWWPWVVEVWDVPDSRAGAWETHMRQRYGSAYDASWSRVRLRPGWWRYRLRRWHSAD